MVRKSVWLGVALLAGVTTAQAAVQVGEGRIEAAAVGMAGLSSEPSRMAAGVGLDGVYTRAYNETLTFGVGGSVALPLFETKDSDTGAYGGAPLLGLESTTGGRSGLFFSLNRFYAHHQKPGYDLMAGRFLFDSPLVSSSQGFRMAPNAVEAVVATFDDKAPNFRFSVGYVNAFSGPSSGSLGSNGSDKGSFASMSDTLFGTQAGGNSNVDNMGVLTGAALYQNDEAELKGQGWLYLMPAVKTTTGKGGLSAIYLDGSKALPVGAHRATASAQLINVTGTEDADAYSHSIIGAMFQMEISEPLTIEAALNAVSGDGGIVEPWGPTPAYASGYEASIAGLHKGQVVRVGGRYALGDLSETFVNANVMGNLVYQNGKDDNGADYSATHLEGVFRAKVQESVDGDARLLIGGGDAEGMTLLLRAAYRF
ncbi:MAG: hypothetical protein AB7E49_05520 [Campylobacterales bacterium]